MSDRLSHLIDLASDNLLLLLLLGGGYWYGTTNGIITPITMPTLGELPAWYELVGLGLLAALLLGVLAGGKIYDLLPEPPRRYVVVMQEDREAVHGIWRLTPDTFAEMEVVDGPLFQWPNTVVPTYEALAYDVDANRATANWRESVPASDVLGKSEVTDAIDQMGEIRADYEQEARIGNAIRRRIAGILRHLDRRRAVDQNRALEGHLAPDLGEGMTTDQIIAEHLGDLAPGYMDNEQAARETQDDLLEIVDGDTEALVDVEPDGGEIEP